MELHDGRERAVTRGAVEFAGEFDGRLDGDRLTAFLGETLAERRWRRGGTLKALGLGGRRAPVTSCRSQLRRVTWALYPRAWKNLVGTANPASASRAVSWASPIG